jgi:hypothetical protein
MSIDKIKDAIKSNKKVYWKTLLYEVKIDFDGDLILKCSDNNLKSLVGLSKEVNGDFQCSDNELTSLDGLSIYNLKRCINLYWYTYLNSTVKEDYFDKNLDTNPEIIGLINFELSNQFKTKWEHLLNANKFDLI